MKVMSYVISIILSAIIGILLIHFGWRGEGWMMRSDSNIAIELPFMIGPLLYLFFIGMIVTGIIFIFAPFILWIKDKG